MALYTLGNYEAGYNLTRFARSIAGDGPYKYAVETYFCIASTLANKLDEAIHAGEIAYQLKPDFNASLRYLAVLYAHKGNRRRHNTVLSQLRRSDPEFSIQKMLEHSTYPSEVLRKAPILFLEG